MLLNEKGERCCCTHGLPVTERVGGWWGKGQQRGVGVGVGVGVVVGSEG